MKPLKYFVVRAARGNKLGSSPSAWREPGHSNVFPTLLTAMEKAQIWTGKNGYSYDVFEVTLIGGSSPALPPVQWEYVSEEKLLPIPPPPTEVLQEPLQSAPANVPLYIVEPPPAADAEAYPARRGLWLRPSE